MARDGVTFSNVFDGGITLEEPMILLDDGQSVLERAIALGGDWTEVGAGELGGTAETVAGEAVELPHHSQLKPEYEGMYVRYDSSCPDQHWGRADAVRMALLVAYNWWHYKFRPTLLIGDISARSFSQTRCHSAHKTGTHVDMDLALTLPRDPGYGKDEQLKCAQLAWFALQARARRVLFGDAVVAQAVNRLAEENGLTGRVVVRADHDDHFHIEIPL